MLVAATGHRPVKITNGDKLNAYDSTVFDRVVALAAASLKHVKAEVVISGMALGWDMAIAEAARQLTLPLWA